MDPTVIKKTQETLGKVIKKPPLTEKLLSKPPFRFLHDILTEVIKVTGVLKGLFKPEEMNSENVKDKEAKMLFLQKAIDCVGIMIGETLSVRPSKIVAGHEPEKTNEFLQSLGKVCLKKMDSAEAVKKTLSGEKPSSGKSRKKESSRTSSKERPKEGGDKSKDKDSKKDEKDSRKKDDRKERSSSSGKDRDKEKDTSRRGREERDRNSEKEKEKEKSRDRDRSKDKDRKKEQEQERSKDVNKQPDDEIKPSTNAEPTPIDAENEDGNAGNRVIQRPSSAKGQRRRPTNSETDKESKDITNDVIMDSAPAPKQTENADESDLQEDDVIQRQPSSVRRPARPSSARPAPPKIKRNEEIEDPGLRLGSGKQVNAVIVDNGKEQDDEDDLFVVEDNTPHDSFLEENVNENPAEIEDGQHGSLVKKMLDSRREAEIVQSKSLQNKEKPIIIDATRKKEKEMAQKEIEKLRNSIQTLCRSAHPLGKIMDYLQEDMDSMQKELENWKEQNKKYHLALKAEQSITENDIEPLHAQLGELELEIADMVDRIGSVKSNIIRNEEKIRDMVSGISR